jgi:FkbM family methyltransferase
MNLVYRAYKLFKNEGLISVLYGAKKKLISPLDPLYQCIKPAYRTYSVGATDATFSMKPRRLDCHDFVDDLNSERDLIKRMLNVTKKDDIFYDVGANIGVHSCLIGNYIESGRLVAFEPIPDVFNTLEENIAQNGIKADLFNIALSNENSTTRMAIEGQTGHQFSKDNGSLEIEMRRADDVVTDQNLSLPDICKIDIEGAEYLALEGFQNTLAESPCRHVFCEIHTSKIEEVGGSAEEVESLLQRLGFNIEYMGDRRENYFIQATNLKE